MSPIYSHCANNTGKYFYGATSGGLAGGTGLNQYHMGDIYGSAIIAAKRGYQYSKNGTQGENLIIFPVTKHFIPPEKFVLFR